MDSRDLLNTLLLDLGKEIGLPDLTADEDGFCSLEFDSIPLHFQSDSETDHLLLFTDLGVLPMEDRVDFLEEMLEANVFFAGTGGATLGLLPGGEGKAFLCQREPLSSLDPNSFRAMLENFVSVAESWRERLSGTPAGEQAGDSNLSSFLQTGSGSLA